MTRLTVSLGAVAGLTRKQETAELCETLEPVLCHLSVESPWHEGLLAVYVGEVGGFQGSKA